jgi:hypothetical protein
MRAWKDAWPVLHHIYGTLFLIGGAGILLSICCGFLTDNGCATDRGEQHAFLLEANTQLVDGAIGAVNSLLATGMDWDQVKVCVVRCTVGLPYLR